MATTTADLLTTFTTQDKSGNRYLERIFHLPVVRVDQYGEPHHSALAVYVGHSSNGKRFIVNFTRAVISPSSFSTIIDFGGKPGEHPVQNYAVPVARYSAKALQATYDEALKVADANLEALLIWADGALDEHGITAG